MSHLALAEQSELESIDSKDSDNIEQGVERLLSQMTLTEKLGQMSQLCMEGPSISATLVERLQAGTVGSILNLVDVEIINQIQKIAVEKSRLGIPLLIGRDVIHGFNTVMPIPLGQAASWNPEIVRKAAKVAAHEAARHGVNWTFAPMLDVSRDARWGRIAESFGEDTLLTSVLAAATVEGYQGDDLTAPGGIAACAKHFVGYGASEAGRDYSTTNIPDNELRNVYLPPFKAAVDAGVQTIMTSFSDIDGLPASGNRYLVTDVLRGEWGFDGLVVSDWDSIGQLRVHGLTANDAESAREAINAGVDMEMFSSTYIDNAEALLASGEIELAAIDRAVSNILRVKFKLGLFENPYAEPDRVPPAVDDQALETAQQAALESVVLLKNDADALPLNKSKLKTLAVIGPLADAPYEQLGTWIFDGDPSLSVTPLAAIQAELGEDVHVEYVQAMQTSRSRDTAAFAQAEAAAKASDAVLLFLGEESILSGEAHSRANIDLPGAQAELVQRLRAVGKPVIAVIMAGRPLTLSNIIDHVDAVLFAWHPGTMGGPALAELIFGRSSPSGKLPVSFPSVVGQVPIYYNHKNTGRPATPDSVVHIDDIDAGAPQVSLGMTAFHLDAGYKPLFPFGYGLSYSQFEYQNIRLSAPLLRRGQQLSIEVELANTGAVEATEIAQLYIRDLVGSLTRPVLELKGFQRIKLQAGERRRLSFTLSEAELAFSGRDKTWQAEPGDFLVYVGGSSEALLQAEFTLVGE